MIEVAPITLKDGAPGKTKFTIPLDPPAIVMGLVNSTLVAPELAQRFFPGFETIETEVRFDGEAEFASILRETPFVFVVTTAG